MPARSTWSKFKGGGVTPTAQAPNYTAILSDGSEKLYTSHFKVIGHVMRDLALSGKLPEFYPNGVTGKHLVLMIKALDEAGYKPQYLKEVLAAVRWKAKQEGFKKHWGKGVTVEVRELVGQISRRKGLAAEKYTDLSVGEGAHLIATRMME
jgi:hypothetical protein